MNKSEEEQVSSITTEEHVDERKRAKEHDDDNDSNNEWTKKHECDKKIEEKISNDSVLTLDRRTKEQEKKDRYDDTSYEYNRVCHSNDKTQNILKKTKKNTTVSSFSPAYISDPVYQWEVSSNDRIFYDKVNDFVIHQNSSTKALLVTDIKKTDENYNGVYVKFEKELCEHICFNLNGSFFLYYCINPNKIEISDILSNHNIYLNVEINKLNDYEILSVFWLNNSASQKDKSLYNVSSNDTSPIKNGDVSSSCEFVVVTNCTIEIFEITFDSLTIQPLKKHYINSKFCWYDENSLYIVLLSTKNHVLLPYFLSNNTALKLPKIELNIPKTEQIKQNDIQIVTLYNETYCIHKDHKNGRISFRCLSSTFYFDYVVDLFCNGVIDMVTVDNLLVVFNNSNEKVYLFDILHKKNESETTARNSLTRLNNHTINVTCLTHPKNFKTQINFSHITFISFNALLDIHFGNLYKIWIDYDVLMLQICQYYSNLNTSVDVLLRRPNCKSRVTEMIFLSLENEIKLEDFLVIVNIINANYRKIVEEVAKKNILNSSNSNIVKENSSSNSFNTMSHEGINSSVRVGNRMNKKITQLLDNLLKNVEDKTLITEKDVVISVFHPYMIKKYNLTKKETLFNFSINFRQRERKKKMQEKESAQKYRNDDEKYMLKYKIKKEKEEQSDLTFDSDSYSPDTDVHFNEEKEKKVEEIDSSKTEEPENKKNVGEKGTNTISIIETSHNVLSSNCDRDFNMGMKYLHFQNVPLFLIYVLEYMRSLLHLNILPNRILQTFIFDLCIFFKQDNCLRQLLQFFTISDSVEITKRLFHFWKLTKHKWAFQCCLDMSLRLKEYEMIIHLFLCSKQYLKVMPFLRKYNLIDYPILIVLQTIENDFDLPDKYIILNHVLQSLSHWIQDSQKDPIKYPMPNLQNCQKWFELVEDI